MARLPSARLVDPLLVDFASAAETIQRFVDTGDRLGEEADALAARLDEPAGGLGRLRSRKA
jgi:hypothetical protein